MNMRPFALAAHGVGDCFARKEAIAVLREFLEIGKITPIIDSTHHLREVREALRLMIEDETRGKVIVNPAAE